MKEIVKTLIIGLGGTGQDVIRDIKKRLLMRYGEIPALVRFLAIDIDQDDYQETPFRFCCDGEYRETKRYNLQRDEFLRMHRPNYEILREDESSANLNLYYESHQYLLDDDSPTPLFSQGARGSRVYGRAHLLYNADDIILKLKHLIDCLKNTQQSSEQMARGYRLSNNSVTVFIISSLAGGTGSSAIMDMSRMVQHAGIAPNRSDRIIGMFFLPSFFKGKTTAPNIGINTYVALSELDHVLGLNDHVKYPDGCLERMNDLNVYGQFKSYVPVRYSNVFLVDEKTKRGHRHSYSEATGSVACFIAASVAAENHALDSSFSNSPHLLHTVEGKYQRYSGLGFCEIRFDRHGLVDYLLNLQVRELIDAYKSFDSTVDMEGIADRFITDNHLDRLADSIYQVDDSRFTRIHMRETETGREADSIIERNKDKYLNEILNIATVTLERFRNRTVQLSDELYRLLSVSRRRKGFERFPHLIFRLRKSFNSSLQRLNFEIASHKDHQNDIEKQLHRIKQDIASCVHDFLFIIGHRDDQAQAIDAYVRKVKVLAVHQLEILRKAEAVRIYEDLLQTIDGFYKENEVAHAEGQRITVTGSYTDVLNTFDELSKLIDAETLEYNLSRTARNGIISIDAFFKEYFQSHPIEACSLPKQEIDYFDEYVFDILKGNFVMDRGFSKRMRECMLRGCPEDSLIKRIANEQISLDELFIHCFGRADDIEKTGDLEHHPQLGIFRQIECFLDALWAYDPFYSPGSLPPVSLCAVGVSAPTNHLFDRNNGYGVFLPKDSAFQFFSHGDPDKIEFLLQETAIPAFKMKDAKRWEDDYNQKKHHIYAFSDKRLEDIDMIMPEKRT